MYTTPACISLSTPILIPDRNICPSSVAHKSASNFQLTELLNLGIMPPKQVKKAWTGKAPKRPRSDKEAQSDEERPPPKRRARKIKGKQAEREPTDEPTDEPTGEPAQSDEELPKKATTRAKRRQADVGQSDEAAESGETRPAKRNRKDGKAKKTSTGKEKGTGKGKAIKKKPA